MRFVLISVLTASVFGAVSLAVAADTDICGSARLTAVDRSACADRMRTAATDEEKERVVAEFSQRLKPGGTADSGSIGTRAYVASHSDIDAQPTVAKQPGSSAGALSGDASAIGGMPLPGSSGQPLLRPNPGVGATGGVRTTGGGALPQ